MLVFNVQLCWTFKGVSVMFFNFAFTIMKNIVACAK